MLCCGVLWCAEVCCGVVAWRGVAWRGVAWRGVAWRGVAWCGVVCCQQLVQGTHMVVYGCVCSSHKNQVPNNGCVAQGHGRISSHKPELVLNNFDTQLGQRVGRMFASLFDQDPQFKGRRVVTFHNQRDYVFFRCVAGVFGVWTACLHTYLRYL